MKQVSHSSLSWYEQKQRIFSSPILNQFAIQTCQNFVKSWRSFSLFGIDIEKGIITASCIYFSILMFLNASVSVTIGQLNEKIK